MKKIAIYEINEVPWQVVDYYLEKRPKAYLAKFIGNSTNFITETKDSGELHPWSTWPTLHRGVTNDTHNIRSLNQDLSAADDYPPIWEILNTAGVTTGICGSLQSYPPRMNSSMSFHIPDTFSAGSETKPQCYSPFQAFNLKQTGDNNAQASGITATDIFSVFGLLRAGVKLSTLVKIGLHVANEFRNPLYKRRRSLLQPLVAFDVFKHCLKNQNQAQFVTFFSNHVAGIMHRYWKYSFPKEFDYSLESKTDYFHSESLMIAMDLFDSQLKELDRWALRNDYELVLCSSMGQEAIDRGEYVREAKISGLSQINQALGYTGEI